MENLQAAKYVFCQEGPGYRRDLHLRHIIYRRGVPTAGNSYQCVDRTLQEGRKAKASVAARRTTKLKKRGPHCHSLCCRICQNTLPSNAKPPNASFASVSDRLKTFASRGDSASQVRSYLDVNMYLQNHADVVHKTST